MHRRHLFVVFLSSFLIVLFDLSMTHNHCTVLSVLYIDKYICYQLQSSFTQTMGCFQSSESIDFDTIQPTVLRNHGGISTYSGTTERGRCQVSENQCTF